MHRLSIVYSLMLLGVIQTTTSATMITNVTTSTAVFKTDYENAASASHLPAPVSGNFYDSPQIGTTVWGNFGEGTDQVTDSTTAPDPGPFQGTNYERVYWQAANPFNANGIADQATSIQNTPGNHIQISTMVYLPSATDSIARMQFLVASDLTTTNSDASNNLISWVRGNGAGDVIGVTRTPNGSGGFNTGTYDAHLPYLTNVWQKWTVDYIVGASTFSLTVGSNTATGLPVITPAGVGSAYFTNSGSVSGSFYLDGVATPEPGTLGLAVVGVALAALGTCRRKRR